MSDYAKTRERMVQEQLEARGIRNPEVLRAMREVPRDRFVEEGLASGAYGDHALPIGFGQTISQPFMVALMTELLEPQPHHRILDVGTGSGYQAAVLAKIVRTVFGIERIAQLTLRAQETLTALGVENVVLQTGDGTIGWKRFAPFDGILVAAGGPRPPAALIEQLNEGGRLVMPAGSRESQRLLVVEKHAGGKTSAHWGIGCSFVPLLGREAWEEP